MAYAVALSQEDEEQTIFLPKFEGGDAGLTVDMEFNGRIIRGADLSGCLLVGRPIPPELFGSVPKRIIIPKDNEKYLPDFGVGPSGGFHLVSEAFVDIVQRLEPSRHQFLPIAETLDSGRTLINKRYFIMNIYTRINAVDIGHSTVRVEERERILRIGTERKTITIKTMHWQTGTRKLVFKREQLEGRHIWRGTTEDIVEIGFSEELFRAVHTAGLSPLSYMRAEEI